MAMEWVHGTDAMKLLYTLHAQGQRLPVDAALHIVAKVLTALEYAHGKTDVGRWLQIVHRDVSPHNVMVSFTGQVALTDFVIAKATSRLYQTRGHVIKGKLGYMAPEQAVGGPLDHRADLFAVGVVAFELLTGSLPYVGTTPTDGLMAMLEGRRPTVRALRPEVPPEVEAFVDTLLSVEAERRFPDAGAARDALEPMPSLATGERTLQRLVRDLFAGEAFSTVTPRFVSPGSPTAPVPGDASPLGIDTTLVAPPPALAVTVPTVIEGDGPTAIYRPMSMRAPGAAGPHALEAPRAALPSHDVHQRAEITPGPGAAVVAQRERPALALLGLVVGAMLVGATGVGVLVGTRLSAAADATPRAAALPGAHLGANVRAGALRPVGAPSVGDGGVGTMMAGVSSHTAERPTGQRRP
jgi:serine/threonine-protein kinase